MKILSRLWLGLGRKCDLAMTKVFSSFGYVNSFLKTSIIENIAMKAFYNPSLAPDRQTRKSKYGRDENSMFTEF